MGRTPFYRTSNKLKHVHQLVIKLKHTIFCFERTKNRTSNLIGLSLDLLNYSTKWLEHHYSNIEQTQRCSSIGKSNSNTLYLASNDRTSKFEHCSTQHYNCWSIIIDFTIFFFAEWYETGEACQNAGNCSKRGPDMYWHMFTRKISKDSTKAEARSTSLWFVILRGLTKFEAFFWNGIWVKTRHFRYSNPNLNSHFRRKFFSNFEGSKLKFWSKFEFLKLSK